MMAKFTGVILWQNDEVVCIATLHSENVKTGDMIQTWILLKDINPVEAVNIGMDSIICDNCSHRGVNGKERSCYVNVGQAPLKIFKSYKDDNYPIYDESIHKELFVNRSIRIGSYGDPSFVPIEVWNSILKLTKESHTGYTHRWKIIDNQYSRILMASCDNELEIKQANEMGYKCFIVANQQPLNSLECINSTHDKQCVDCGLCNGNKHGLKTPKNIWIAPHGKGKKYILSLV